MGTHQNRNRQIVIAVAIGAILVAICSAIVFVCLSISAEPAKQNYIEYNDNVSDLTFFDVSGQESRFDKETYKIVVYLSGDCGTCVDALPVLNENRLEQIRDNSMETVGELPFGYNPSDFATDGTDIFIYSERFFTLDRFDKEGNYLETLYQFDHNVGIKYLAYDKVTNSIYASAPTEGKVYRFSPEQEE